MKAKGAAQTYTENHTPFLVPIDPPPFLPRPLRSKGGFKALPPKANS